eukprot:5675064-Heterocapsa_arctica.AAC.1
MRRKGKGEHDRSRGCPDDHRLGQHRGRTRGHIGRRRRGRYPNTDMMLGLPRQPRLVQELSGKTSAAGRATLTNLGRGRVL